MATDQVKFATPDSSPNKAAAGQAEYSGSHPLRSVRGSQYGCPAFPDRSRASVKQRHLKDTVPFPRVGSGQLPASVRQHPLLPEPHRLFCARPDVIVKCADWDPVFYAPLAVGKPAGSALGDQF